MRRRDVRRFARQRHLDGGRAPGDEGCEAALADAEQGFVDLEFFALESEGMEGGRIENAYVGGVGLALDDV